jgi:hypothetical protein
MKFTLFGFSFFPQFGTYGIQLCSLETAENAPRSLFHFAWDDRECFLSVFFLNIDWVCLLGYKEED